MWEGSVALWHLIAMAAVGTDPLSIRPPCLLMAQPTPPHPPTHVADRSLYKWNRGSGNIPENPAPLTASHSVAKLSTSSPFTQSGPLCPGKGIWTAL